MRQVTLRLATPADLPLIRRFHQEQNEAHGTQCALPTIFAPNGDFARNIPIALIGEEGGVARNSLYVDLVPELCFAGCDPKATAYAQRDIDRLAYLLRGQGLTSMQTLVPIQADPAIGKPLRRAGFEPTDTKLRHYFKDLREEQE